MFLVDSVFFSSFRLFNVRLSISISAGWAVGRLDQVRCQMCNWVCDFEPYLIQGGHLLESEMLEGEPGSRGEGKAVTENWQTQTRCASIRRASSI